MRLIYLAAFALMLGACEKTDKKEEVQFEGATFGFISKSKTTLETTLHSRQIYFKATESSDPKVLIGYGSVELDIFPTDKNILTGIDYTIVDTLRYADMLPPTESSNTLYMDPAIFSKEDYALVVRFVQSNFKQPITGNRLVKWLDDDVLGVIPGAQYHTVYAVVYQKMAAFEKEYKAADGPDHFVIRVDNHLRISQTKDGLQMESAYDYTFRNDTLFYPEFDGVDEATRMLSFKNRDGKAFSEVAKVLVATSSPR